MAYCPGSISLKPFALSYSAVGTRLSKKRFVSSRRPERNPLPPFSCDTFLPRSLGSQMSPENSLPGEQLPNERACSGEFNRRKAGAKIAAIGRASQQLLNSVWSSHSAALSLRAI